MFIHILTTDIVKLLANFASIWSCALALVLHVCFYRLERVVCSRWCTLCICMADTTWMEARGGEKEAIRMEAAQDVELAANIMCI